MRIGNWSPGKQFMVAWLVLLSLLAVSCGPTDDQETELKIVGGARVTAEQNAPAVAVVVRPNTVGPFAKLKFCTATRIDAKRFVTSAECMAGVVSNGDSVLKLVSSVGTAFDLPSVGSVILHPSYSPVDGTKNPHNIATFTLGTIPEGFDAAVSVALIDGQVPTPGTAVVAMGGGCEQAAADGTCKGAAVGLKGLKYLETRMIASPAGETLPGRFLYTKASDGYVADGDMGGPLLIPATQGSWRLVGIAAYANRSFDRVPAYLSLNDPEIRSFVLNPSNPVFTSGNLTAVQDRIKSVLASIDTALAACQGGVSETPQPGFPSANNCNLKNENAKNLRIEALLLARAHVEAAQNFLVGIDTLSEAERSRRLLDAAELVSDASRIYEFALTITDIAVSLTPLGRLKDGVECALGRSVLPDFKKFDTIDRLFSCVGALGLDERLLKWTGSAIAKTETGAQLIKKLGDFIAPLNKAVGAIERVYGKIRGVPKDQIAGTLQRIRDNMVGSLTDAEVEAVVELCTRTDCQNALDYENLAKTLGNTERLEAFRRMQGEASKAASIVKRGKPISGTNIQFVSKTISNPQVVELTEEIQLVRYYGGYDASEPMSAYSKIFAQQLGGYWGSQVYKSKDSFYKGSVVFEEWNSGRRIVSIKVHPGVVVVYGGGQSVTITGLNQVQKTLPASPDLQYAFPVDPNWMALDPVNNTSANWLAYLQKTGAIEIVEDIATRW